MTLPTDHNCFIRFGTSIDAIVLPERFTYPFNYTPHPLCQLAVSELKNYLLTQTTWNHDFGIENPVEGTSIGKMFGVLIVRTPQNEIGYLAAFSGKIAGENFHANFVPPIVDMLNPNGFYRKGELEISAINQRISAIEVSLEYQQAKETHRHQTLTAEQEIQQFRQNMKVEKKHRDAQRQNALIQVALNHLMPNDFETLKEKLKNDSLKLQYHEKQLLKYWKDELQISATELSNYTNLLAELKEERKTMSASLQQRLFNQYHFLNIHKQTESVCEIFAKTDKLVPPAGAGDCAAPKLLQYAFAHQLQPLAMAEFWWGLSPKNEIRLHGNYYPSCRSKCEPILGYMLQDIPIDSNPTLVQPAEPLVPTIIYEDEFLGVLAKPAELLSVPAKYNAPSVYTFLQQRYPNATGPIMVHRLDMSTSGLMLFAKTLETYHALQRQFLNRSVKKRYIALLQGIVPLNNGVINLPLRVDLDNRPHQLVCPQYGKPATTLYHVLNRKNQQTRIQFEPITGRTHQLRVHAAHPLGLNCPIVGDDLYGQPSNRLHLHAEYLQFTHPITGEVLDFQLNPDF